jgi:hypothetical protein
VDLAEVKGRWLGFEFDTREFRISKEMILEYASVVGESDPRYCDPSHADFQAAPTLPNLFMGGRVLPEGFPRFARRGFDAGKCVIPKAAIRAGDVLVGRSHVEDIYEKTGRSGPMYFIVHRMEFSNQRGELVSVVDWRMVQQP